MLETLKLIHRSKLRWLISWHPIDQQSSPSYHSFLTVPLSYHINVNLVGPLDAGKQAEAGFLFLFIIGFPTSLLIDMFSLLLVLCLNKMLLTDPV